jgi:hypothetical protein
MDWVQKRTAGIGIDFIPAGILSQAAESCCGADRRSRYGLGERIFGATEPLGAREASPCREADGSLQANKSISSRMS